MLSRMKMTLTAAALSAVAFASAPAAIAAPAGAAPSDVARQIVDGPVPAEFTRYRGRRGFGRGYRGYYGGRGYYGRRRNRGAAIGAGIAGLAAGAIIGGALAAQAQPVPVYGGGNAVAYCAQRFRSYDPASGTYLGFDGARHACP